MSSTPLPGANASYHVGLAGPEPPPVLDRAGLAAPDLAHLPFADVTWQQKTITLLRSGEEARESWQVWINSDWISPEQRADLWNALVHAGARPAGTAALNLFRISRGIPQFREDIRERALPQETGQTRALNFTTRCYLRP